MEKHKSLDFRLEDFIPIRGLTTIDKRNKNSLNTSGEGFMIRGKEDFLDAIKYGAFCVYQGISTGILPVMASICIGYISK